MTKQWVEVGQSLGDNIPLLLDKLKVEYPNYHGMVRFSPRGKDGFHKIEFELERPAPVTSLKPGDVTPDGLIISATPGVAYRSGRVVVTVEQADKAYPHGWRVDMFKPDTFDGLCWICRE